jgi:hypothetical protein
MHQLAEQLQHLQSCDDPSIDQSINPSIDGRLKYFIKSGYSSLHTTFNGEVVSNNMLYFDPVV